MKEKFIYKSDWFDFCFPVSDFGYRACNSFVDGVVGVFRGVYIFVDFSFQYVGAVLCG